MATARTTIEVNYYEVLGVSPGASTAEIRKSFRRLVLEAHPDKNPERQEWSERRIRELVQAFEVVGNDRSREEFDARLRVCRQVRPARPRRDKPFFYYKSDPESRAMLILHHLLKGRPEEAAGILGDMEELRGRGFLAEYLDRSDYLDCLFLLSEHFTAARQYLKAVDRLHEFYRHESQARFPRHYLDEVVRRLKDLYLRKLPRFEDAEHALRGLTQVQELGLTKSEELTRLRKLVELHILSGMLGDARRALTRAQALDPSCKRLRKLEEGLEKAEQRG